ncbi:hypothetical protein PybrP1_006771 [[Pythium] brassicae (nom. inval.)]|nr:hypothetical protein PybrP1_006771 [[Pythium] brassicae (nom. inval.)]
MSTTTTAVSLPHLPQHPKHADLQQDIGTKIVLGGIANTIACAVTHPIDTIKVRLQLQSLVASPMAVPTFATSSSIAGSAAVLPTRYLGFRHGLLTILREEGFVNGWYKGVQASLIREASYSSLRFGLYDVVKEIYEDKVFPNSGPSIGGTTPLYIKLLAGATSGAVGSALASPMDLVKVRMQSDRTGERYGNRFLFACKDIYQHDGLIKGFYRGVGPTTFRAMALTAAQLPSYDHMKVVLLQSPSFEEGFTVHMIASMFAGLMAATASSPLDVIKTKIMNECSKTAVSPDDFRASKQLMRKAFVDVMRQDGLRGFFKGWLPNWMRLGPHTIITLMVYEELRAMMGLKPV